MNLTRMMVQHHVKFGIWIPKLLVSLCLVSMVSIYSPFELAYQVELNTNLRDYGLVTQLTVRALDSVSFTGFRIFYCPDIAPHILSQTHTNTHTHTHTHTQPLCSMHACTHTYTLRTHTHTHTHTHTALLQYACMYTHIIHVHEQCVHTHTHTHT